MQTLPAQPGSVRRMRGTIHSGASPGSICAGCLAAFILVGRSAASFFFWAAELPAQPIYQAPLSHHSLLQGPFFPCTLWSHTECVGHGMPTALLRGPALTCHTVPAPFSYSNTSLSNSRSERDPVPSWTRQRGRVINFGWLQPLHALPSRQVPPSGAPWQKASVQGAAVKHASGLWSSMSRGAVAKQASQVMLLLMRPYPIWGAS